MTSFNFPPWTNKVRPLAGALLGGGGLYLVCLVWWGFSPKTTDVGYQPKQPVPYSHALHAGKLGMDCRYCHNTVERAAFAAVPPTETCMNCHSMIKTKSAKLEAVCASWENDTSVDWVQIHDLPDFVYFNHSAHVTRGVGCESCHGRIDKMEVVHQQNTLSMGWCLDCHRNPEAALRPPELVTKMGYVPDRPQAEVGHELREKNNINPPVNCSTCHR
ncbi:MAG: cytochrome c3 family protein [Clostridia bacterium]|nr:cytochrome c3 family protein [Deltaproteobacteria bacterium]